MFVYGHCVAILHSLCGAVFLLTYCKHDPRYITAGIVASLFYLFKRHHIIQATTPEVSTKENRSTLRYLVYTEMPIWCFFGLIELCAEAPFGAEKLWHDVSFYRRTRMLLFMCFLVELIIYACERAHIWTVTLTDKELAQLFTTAYENNSDNAQV